MSELQSEDESEPPPIATRDPMGVEDGSEEFELSPSLPGVGGGAKAAVAKTNARRRQHTAAVQDWEIFEVSKSAPFC